MSPQSPKQESWAKLDARMASLIERPDQLQHQLRAVRADVYEIVGQNPEEFDQLAANWWATNGAPARRLVLEPVLEGVDVGPLLLEALLKSVETADDRSANAALSLLAGEAELSGAQWQRLARVARRQRSAWLPDIDAVQLLARRGPPQALASVALTAFRQGPEDADDRLACIAALGRFDDDRVLGWLISLGRTGSCSMEVLQAAAQAMALGLHGGERENPLANLLLALARADVGLDALLRWSALEGLSHLRGTEALAAVLAAHRAGGSDLPDGYVQGLAALAMSLEPSLAKGGEAGLVAAAEALAAGDHWPPVPGRDQRAMSRDARVARQAAFEEPHPSQEVLHARAGIEAALVARKQLVGTLLPAAAPTPIPEHFAANWRCLSQTERDQLANEETSWLGAERV
jgi:hypothetical protein